MKEEYEVKVLEIDPVAMEIKLQELGAQLKGNYFQKRYTYDFHPSFPKKWIRLRCNGEKTELTIKDVYDKTKIGGTKELEFEVSDFALAHQFLKELGYPETNYQENKRIQYHLDGVEIDLDSWPMIPTYMEIEGSSEDTVQQMIQKLGLDENKNTTLDVASVYQEYYDIGIQAMPILLLENDRQ